MVTLRIESIECENLPSLDGSRGTTDPYVIIRCGGAEVQTAYKSNARHPQWFASDFREMVLRVSWFSLGQGYRLLL